MGEYEFKILNESKVICLVCGSSDSEVIWACIKRFELLSGEPDFPGYPCTLEEK